MIFKELNEIEYEKFAANYPQASFLQSSASGKRRSIDGWNMHLVGVIRKGKIVASAMLSSRKTFLGYYDFECQHGPLVDYDDVELTKFFIKKILSYVKSKKGLGIRINPNLALNHRDEAGLILDDGYDGRKYIDLLVESGLSKMDDNIVDQDSNLLRWYYKKDMRAIHNDEDLFKSVKTKARQDMQRSEKSGVKVDIIDIKDLDIFLKLMESTGRRRNFDWRDQKYYASLLDYFGPAHAMCAVAKLDVAEYRSFLGDKLNHENTELDILRADKIDVKLAPQIVEHETQINDLKKKIEEAKAMVGDHIVTAGAIFIVYGSELVYLSSAAYKEYSKFCSPYAIQLFAMRYAINHNIPVYNFYGTKGSFSGNPDMDGVYNFKKGFSGYLEEQVGYFYKNVRPFQAHVLDILRKTRNILK